MASNNENVCMSRLMDHLIGTGDQVRCIQRLVLLMEYGFNSDKDIKIIHTGSTAEGYQLQSSDIDRMIQRRDVVAFSSAHSGVEYPADKTVLLMRRDGCQPGYVILQILLGNYDRDVLVKWKRWIVVSSSLVRTYHRQYYDFDIHGPCLKDVLYGSDRDQALAIECKQWPKEARGLFRRRRKYGWPRETLLGSIRRKGCHLVAVGDQTSDLFSIQWRISFAVAERMLVHSFNHTQLRVYVLMKIFHKQVIEAYEGVKDLLCSYFIKTTMFYMIENTNPLEWRDDNLITLFWSCFLSLTESVENGYCPNYFMPENNLFKSKIFGQNQDSLVRVLHGLKREGWQCIYRCDALKEMREESFNLRLRSLSSDMKYSEARKDFTLFEFCTKSFLIYDILHPSTEFTLWKVIKILHMPKTRSDEQILVSLSRILLGIVGRCIFHDTKMDILNKTGNKNSYKSVRICEVLFSEASNFDMSRGPLHLALFYHALKRYDKVIQICNKVISSTPLYTRREKRLHFQTYRETICGQGMGIAEKMKKTLALEVEIMLTSQLFYPKELQHEITAATFSSHVVIYPPVALATFLKFLCHHERGEIDSSLSVLHDLKILAWDKQLETIECPLILHLVAICQDKVGDSSGAVETCRVSLQLVPKVNSARPFLYEILSRKQLQT